MFTLPARGKSLRLIQLLLVVAPSFILFGYNQSVVGGLLSLDDWVKTFPRIDTVNTEGAQEANNSTIQGLVVATFTLGALVGALSCSYTGDRLGRRKVIFIGGLCTLIGEAICCSSVVLAQFIIGRVIIGLGVGQLSATVPVWQSECSSAKNRGKDVVLVGCFIALGYTIESWVDFGFFQIKTGSIPWRLPLAIPMLFSLIVMGMVFLLPESPRWLVRMGRKEEATEALAAFKGLEPDHHDILAEISGIEVSLETGQKAKLSDLFTMGEDRLFYRFMLCIVLQFFQQMCGSNLVSVYSTIIFQGHLGMDAQLSRIMSGALLTWKFLSSFFAFIAIDRFGRRAVFMISGVGMSLCMTSLAICTSFPTDNKPAAIAASFFLFAFNAFVIFGFLGANFLYCTEVAPVKLRVAMSSISTANHWLWNFVVVMISPVAIDTIGWRYYIVYAVIGACIPVSVYFFYPETMNRNLEQLDDLFRDAPSIFAIVKMAKKLPTGEASAMGLALAEKLDKEEVEGNYQEKERAESA